MTTKTKATNGHATAEDVAQSTPMHLAIPEPLVRRILERQAAIEAAIEARNDVIELARELAGATEAATIQQVPGGGLVFVEPTPKPTPAEE